MNPFSVKNQVRTANGNRVGGIVKYIACFAATNAGGKTCDKKTCHHLVQDYVWVLWGDKTVYSYEHRELSFENPPEAVKEEVKAQENQNYLKEAKQAINNVIEGNRGMSKEDALIYDGFARIVQNRSGERFIQTISSLSGEEDEKKPIATEDLDFDAYYQQGIIVRKGKAK